MSVKFGDRRNHDFLSDLANGRRLEDHKRERPARRFEGIADRVIAGQAVVPRLHRRVDVRSAVIQGLPLAPYCLTNADADTRSIELLRLRRDSCMTRLQPG